MVAGITIGLDLGDRWSHYVELDGEGEVASRGRVPTREPALRKLSGAMEASRVVIEAGGVSGWVSRVLL